MTSHTAEGRGCCTAPKFPCQFITLQLNSHTAVWLSLQLICSDGAEKVEHDPKGVFCGSYKPPLRPSISCNAISKLKVSFPSCSITFCMGGEFFFLNESLQVMGGFFRRIARNWVRQDLKRVPNGRNRGEKAAR